MNVRDSKGKLNFNALAWESPKHGEEYGYLPTDEYYKEICDWLSTCTTRYKTATERAIFVRKSIPDSLYDVKVEFVRATKMIKWTFCKSYEYSV